MLATLLSLFGNSLVVLTLLIIHQLLRLMLKFFFFSIFPLFFFFYSSSIHAFIFISFFFFLPVCYTLLPIHFAICQRILWHKTLRISFRIFFTALKAKLVSQKVVIPLRSGEVAEHYLLVSQVFKKKIIQAVDFYFHFENEQQKLKTLKVSAV